MFSTRLRLLYPDLVCYRRAPSLARERTSRLRSFKMATSGFTPAVFLGGMSTLGERVAVWFSTASWTASLSYAPSAEANTNGLSICSSNAGTRDASRALLLVRSHAMTAPVSTA